MTIDTLASLLMEHQAQHPELTPLDAIKFLHQSFMGGGHQLPVPQDALAHLKAEWTRVRADAAQPLYEPLGNGLCRLSLAACKGLGAAPTTVLGLFLRTVSQFSPQPQLLKQALPLVELLFPGPETRGALARYCQAGMPAVHHSTAYQAAYTPAYRIAFQRDVQALPLLAAIDRRMTQGCPATYVAIDGPCASGKSTLGELLAELYRCPIFHMDDFFLPPAKKTPERLAAPGGNVDAERFLSEVLLPLSQGKAVHYRPYRCQSGTLGAPITVSPPSLAVIEGVYALRPELRPYYHLTCFLQASWPIRQARLLRRGGPGVFEAFCQYWIPLENHYFHAFDIPSHCQLLLDSIE